ncbi:hypothetical protein DSO57_1031120 [Entomophthora muscae]|uniref:Uncharacterized protein n=1 Tax=Entomophthora muscae TaxID=34485 RepID=A0ACC2TMR6_9FUNG|nr:hypothetical protein DSO57_1031120 [Entomophthora muscae]
MLSLILFPIVAYAHSIQYTGKLVDEVATPDVYVNLGQMRKTAVINTGTEKMPGHAGRYMHLHAPTEMPQHEASLVSIPPNSIVASPELDFKLGSITNQNR